MSYVDTNVIVAYVDELDPNHSKAVALLSSEGEKLTSKLTLVELTSVYSRAEFDEPLSLAMYSLKLAGVKLVEADFDRALVRSLELAPILRLRTLDLLHLALCEVLRIKRFATFDREIAARSDVIRRKLGIEVVSEAGFPQTC